MGNKIIRVIIIIIVFVIFLLGTVEIKAETKYEIEIPDEIKIQEFTEFGEENKIGDFEDYTEIESFVKQSEFLPLQKIAIAEAGNEDIQTMAYVIQTVINRKISNEFPDDVEEIIKQKGQFSTYPKKYNKAVPNGDSEQALLMAMEMENKNQLYFENTIPGSWQSTHKEFVFKYNKLSFYK